MTWLKMLQTPLSLSGGVFPSFVTTPPSPVNSVFFFLGGVFFFFFFFFCCCCCCCCFFCCCCCFGFFLSSSTHHSSPKSRVLRGHAENHIVPCLNHTAQPPKEVAALTLSPHWKVIAHTFPQLSPTPPCLQMTDTLPLSIHRKLPDCNKPFQFHHPGVENIQVLSYLQRRRISGLLAIVIILQNILVYKV